MKRWLALGRTPSISVQIMALLVGGLLSAQAATFALSTVLPAPATAQYSLAAIAAALQGGPLRTGGLPALQRTVQRRAPDPRSPGWQVSQGAREDLARLIGVEPARVELLFYSPPPFAGADGRRAEAAPQAADLLVDLLATPARAQPPGGGGGGPGGGRGMGPPPNGWGGAGGQPGSGVGPAGHGGSPTGGGRVGAQGGGRHGSSEGAPAGPQVFDPLVTPTLQGAPDAPMGPLAGPGGGSLAGSAPGSSIEGGGPGPGSNRFGGAGAPGSLRPPMALDGAMATAPLPQSAAPAAEPAAVFDPPVLPSRSIAPLATTRAVDKPVAVGPQTAPATQATVTASAPPRLAEAEADADRAVTDRTGPLEVLEPPISRNLFGAARPPLVDGEFLAALQRADGQWTTVRPLQDPLLSRWQRRLLLWFLAAFAIVAPLGWWISRRLAAPLATLADTADRLGRNTSTCVPATGGAAEIRRLAAALNGMQARLHRHVEDRTAMVGAISHDLRTPLARMRFKLERAPPTLQASLLRDMDHMQDMLDAVLLFIRDASDPAPREVADLRSIVECVVDDAALVGGDASLEPGEPAAVDVDITGVQRVITNLMENALKYGGSARVSLRVEAMDVVVEVEDEGPGLPPEEIARVFQPFYRSEAGRQASAKGIGLGLSVSRSIARAHGGDVTLRNVEGGLIAALRLPLALTVAGTSPWKPLASAA